MGEIAAGRPQGGRAADEVSFTPLLPPANAAQGRAIGRNLGAGRPHKPAGFDEAACRPAITQPELKPEKATISRIID